MPKGKWIDKKTATHFTLVHRPQNDPLIHDESAPSMVLNPTRVGGKNGKSTSDALSRLASELGDDALSIRDNEGEAANHGVYWDDTEYDYMQHLREMGTGGPGQVVFVEGTATGNKNKSKGRQQPLEEALRKLDLEQKSEDLVEKDMLPSKYLPKPSYNAQQDVPDEIAGFQPDMDPRLREVLEALEDDAYVDNEEEDIFHAIAKGRDELTLEEFEETYDDEDDGWASDGTEKPTKSAPKEALQIVSGNQGQENNSNAAQASEDWYEDFKRFQKDQQKDDRKSAVQQKLPPTESGLTSTTIRGRRKKRKGALTNPSNYSMSSVSLARTEHQHLLDERFERLEAEYDRGLEDTASVSAISSMSTASRAALQSGLDGLADDFLETHPTLKTRKIAKNARRQNGLEQLAEIRRDLGAPIVPEEYLKK